MELADRIIPALGLARSGPGRPPEVTNAELVRPGMGDITAELQ